MNPSNDEAAEHDKKNEITVWRDSHGKWWCVNGPQVGECDGLCAGHDTFEEWAEVTAEALEICESL